MDSSRNGARGAPLTRTKANPVPNVPHALLIGSPNYVANSQTEPVAMKPGRQWDTPEKIDAASRELAASMPGWVPPAAHGVVLVPQLSLGTEEVHFPVVNVGAHGLPALVMGSITGRRDETETYEIEPDELARAVEMLAPAETAKMYQHPNLNAWRAILERAPKEPGARIFAVFIASLESPVSSPYDQALRRQIAEGERAELSS